MNQTQVRKNQNTKMMKAKTNRRQRNNKSRDTVMAPIAMNRSLKSSRLSTTYVQTERVGAINTPVSTSFHVLAALPVNPGLPFAFPWLSGHAALFEKYEIQSLTFRFKNLLSTTTNGNVILCFSFDTLDVDPINALVATQKAAYIDGAVWRETVLNVPIRRKELFTRVGNVPPNADLKTYDYGKLWVCTEGVTTSLDNIGYLEMSYKIVLRDKSELLTPYQVVYDSSVQHGDYNQAPVFNETKLSEILERSSFSFTNPIQSSAALTGSTGTFPLQCYKEGGVLATFYMVFETDTAFSAATAGPPNKLDLDGAVRTFAATYAGDVTGRETYYATVTMSINAPMQGNLTLSYASTPVFDEGEEYTLVTFGYDSIYSPIPN